VTKPAVKTVAKTVTTTAKSVPFVGEAIDPGAADDDDNLDVPLEPIDASQMEGGTELKQSDIDNAATMAQITEQQYNQSSVKDNPQPATIQMMGGKRRRSRQLRHKKS